MANVAFAIAPPVADPVATAALPAPALKVAGPDLYVTPSLLGDAQADNALDARASTFKQAAGGSWEVRWDVRGDRPNLVQGSGVPLIAGRGNALAAGRFGAAAARDIDLATVAREARRFIDAQNALLKLDGLDLRLDSERSVVYGKDKTFWSIEFGQYVNDVRVDGAFVFVRVAQGNVVQFGAERIGTVKIDAQPRLAREQAFRLAWQELAFPAGTEVAQTIEPGELRIYPVAPQGEAPASAFAGARGQGYDHVLAWRYVFRVDGNPATWEVLVDAHADRVISLRDLNDYVDATVSGGVYATTNTDPEMVIPFPFAAVTNSGPKVTDTLGIYDYSGGSATTTLGGKYFRMSDNCGAISLSNSTDGNLNFGSGSGTDCVTPTGNTAGPGNTHASRSGFYHLSRINEKARGILPDNTWLQTTVTANMNVNSVCNAFWDGSALNFFKSGGGCSNTGEIAAVFLHEWGHGLDQNTGGAASENGSGEAVGDTFAFLETRDHCIGENFTPGHVCHDCTTCTGVRDVQDFGTLGTRTIASPANVTATGGIDCGVYVGDVSGTACPYVSSRAGAYQGVMGWEGHCESVIASSANWDLAQALVQHFGDSGWDQMDHIWYGSLTPSKSAYQIQSGGRCNTAAVVNGCAATNWYTVYLAADDDDGNLANGTPNACRIWDAFNAHGIACGERPACSADAPDFTLAVENDTQAVCAPADASYVIDVGAQLGFSAPVTLSASGQPAGMSVGFSPNPVTPGGTATMTVSGTGSAAAGDYTISVSGAAAGSGGHSDAAHLTLSAGVPDAPVLSAPADAAADIGVAPTFTWQPVTGAASYTIEVASDATFATIVATQSGLTTTTWAPTSALAPNTQFFWRVRAVDACGAGANATAFSFTTANQICRNPALAIPDNNATGVTDTMTFTDATPLSGLRLHIGATHTFVGDLRFTLTRGTSVIVINEGSCGTANIDVDLADAATSALSCNSSAPAYSGTKKPAHPLSGFDGQPFGGTWSLKVVDTAGQDTGTLDEWCLQGPASAPAAYTVGGTASGVNATGLALSLNGGASLPVSTNGPFTFPDTLAAGAPYAVTIATQPKGETCSIANSSGTVTTANVTDVAVTCIDRIFADGFDGAPQ